MDSLKMGHNPKPLTWPLQCPAAVSSQTSPPAPSLLLGCILSGFQDLPDASLSAWKAPPKLTQWTLFIPQVSSQMSPPPGDVSGFASIVSVFYSHGPSETSLHIVYQRLWFLIYLSNACLSTPTPLNSKLHEVDTKSSYLPRLLLPPTIRPDTWCVANS